MHLSSRRYVRDRTNTARRNELAESFLFCSTVQMTQPDRSSLAQTLLLAPAWARVGLTAPVQRIREQAAAELAQAIIGALEGSQGQYDARQMALPL